MVLYALGVREMSTDTMGSHPTLISLALHRGRTGQLDGASLGCWPNDRYSPQPELLSGATGCEDSVHRNFP